jgi:hypothetical protein
MANERLRAAMAAATVDVDTLAEAAGVDPKTAQRWLAGRVPHSRHRLALVKLLGEEEGYLWPQARPDLAPGSEATHEVVAAYAHRADIPTRGWADLLAMTRRHIFLTGYSFLFLPEQHVDLASRIRNTCRTGCKVRILLADPDGASARERDALERLGGTLSARIRMTLTHLEDIRSLDGVEVRFHDVHLYNAIYRFDDEMIVTPYLVGAHGFQHPALHLRRLGPYGIFTSFAEQQEALWMTAVSEGRSQPSPAVGR